MTEDIRTLLAYIEDDIDEALVRRLRGAIESLAQSRNWLSIPTYVYDVEAATSMGDDDIVTLGAHIELAAAGSPNDSASLRDVEAFVDFWKDLSISTGKTVGFELDGDAVGWIDDGDVSDLEDGMIAPWRAALGNPR